jgi:hypothetical protein
MHQMLLKFHALIKGHFEQQHFVVEQSMKPFLPKIKDAESNYKELLNKFIQKRDMLKDQVKDSIGLGALER